MDDRTRPIEIALEVAAAAPPSMDAVGHLEASLGAWSDVPGFEDFQTAVASYRPGGGERGLLNEAELEFEARQFLHELGHHSNCSH